MIYAGIVEYAAIIAATGGSTLTSITSLTGVEPTLNLFLIVGGIIFVFWLFVFKL